MRWLKSLVTLLGVLIVGGLVLLAYGFYKKSQNPDWRLTHLFWEPAPAPAPAPAAPRPAAPAAFGDVNLGLAAGCLVTDVTPDGRRLYLTIGPPGTCHRVVALDAETGQVLGSIRPTP
jgi:hypothetical protein